MVENKKCFYYLEGQCAFWSVGYGKKLTKCDQTEECPMPHVWHCGCGKCAQKDAAELNVIFDRVLERRKIREARK